MPEEDDILGHWALRFDGHSYLRDHPFDHHGAVQNFCGTGEWHISPLEQLTVFFMLQRFLYKWGGEMLAKTSVTWKAFRSLFLLTYGYEIPEEYQTYEFYEEWLRDYRPNLADHVALVKSIHENTDYSTEV